jgi:hypothetical protein
LRYRLSILPKLLSHSYHRQTPLPSVVLAEVFDLDVDAFVEEAVEVAANT